MAFGGERGRGTRGPSEEEGSGERRKRSREGQQQGELIIRSFCVSKRKIIAFSIFRLISTVFSEITDILKIHKIRKLFDF